jgi:hypothetical protein
MRTSRKQKRSVIRKNEPNKPKQREKEKEVRRADAPEVDT